MPDEDPVRILTEEDCWRLLATVRIGMFAIESGHGPQLFPVNHLVRDRVVSFRSGPGEKTMETFSHPRVAFEADGREGDDFWSVVIEGHVEVRDGDDPSLRGALDALVSLHPTPKPYVVDIIPERISGRRFQPRHPASLWGG
jgi:nitroimidazol reductase NimA-like FMN-containing flavoprotein (pyridoxamine 5'-phosphate oxidase superfamily)